MTNLKDIITPKEKPSAFETLKKMFEEAKDADCLIQDIYWIKEALIDLQKESKNAEELLKNK